MKGIDLFFVMSKTVTDYYVQIGIRREKTLAMPDFYDMDFLQGRATQSNPFQNCPEGTFHILFTGRIYVDKGADLIIEAFSRMKYRDQSMLHVVGDGPQRAELELRVSRYRLEDKVIFHGWKSGDNLLAFYQHADVYVQSSRIPEPMNRVGVEALATGVPLIVTDTSGELWVSDVALIFKNGDVEDLTRALEIMYEHPEKRRQMSENAKKRAQGFDYKKLGKELNSILQNLVTQTNG